MSSNVVYAIVKAGGRQEKVTVGDEVVVDKLVGAPGDSIELEPIMLVDGEKVTTSGISAKVTAEIVEAVKGPKISIVKYKNKTGYRKRQGHRAELVVADAVHALAEHLAHGAHGGISVDRLFRCAQAVFGRQRVAPGGREDLSGRLGLRDFETNRLAVMLRQRLGQPVLDLRPAE